VSAIKTSTESENGILSLLPKIEEVKPRTIRALSQESAIDELENGA